MMKACGFIIALLMLMPAAGTVYGQVPEPPPPTYVPSPLDAPADKKCVEYKDVEITTQCGTENKCWTDPWGAQVCADAPKYCKETITDCARWE